MTADVIANSVWAAALVAVAFMAFRFPWLSLLGHGSRAALHAVEDTRREVRAIKMEQMLTNQELEAQVTLLTRRVENMAEAHAEELSKLKDERNRWMAAGTGARGR